jgi:AmiR/NasT family two-component response regulator
MVSAGYAAVTVNNVASYSCATTEAAQLRVAMESRAVIDQAKGILMVRDRCSPEEAFEVLRRISQNRNVKLRDIAQSIVEAVQK